MEDENSIVVVLNVGVLVVVVVVLGAAVGGKVSGHDKWDDGCCLCGESRGR